MFKFLTKQFIYGRIYLWVKDKLGAILFLFISIFLIIYFHNEYLNYIEYKEKFAESYVGLSFVIKNILILLVAGGYFYFYFVLGRNKKSIEEKSNQKQASIKEESKTSEMVSSLDEFLDDDELIDDWNNRHYWSCSSINRLIYYEPMTTPTIIACVIVVSLALLSIPLIKSFLAKRDKEK